MTKIKKVEPIIEEVATEEVELTPEIVDEVITEEEPKALVETVVFKFNCFVNLGGVRIKKDGEVEVTLEEANEFLKAKLGEIVK